MGNVNGFTFQHVNSFVQSQLQAKDVDVFAVTQEFGTYASPYVFAGMRLENAFTSAYNRCDETEKLDEGIKDLLDMSRRRYRDLFYVEVVDWKTEIVMRGFDLFHAVYHR